MRQKAKVENYDAPAGGWGSLKAVASILTQEEVAILGSEILLKQNKPDGFMCVSCSWAKPAKPRPFEFCENGAKATAWEITRKTVTPEFFAQHTLAELGTWSDHQLEEQGRLTTPMRYDRASDKYLPVDWEEAFAAIGAELNRLDPRSVVMYTSGRASLETSYMYQLFGRMYGTNNFPDSSNMCHETTSVALPEVIGVPVGDRSAGGFRDYRLHLLLRPQHDHQCAAHAASAPGGGAARRADHIFQSAARARPGAFRQSAKSGPDDRRRHAHQLAILSGTGRR
ncbi:anaerobic selenocysteine-containing dehydrogenase [Bradyrhizobium sp. GM5.1]